jgi:hypothetical protein
MTFGNESESGLGLGRRDRPPTTPSACPNDSSPDPDLSRNGGQRSTVGRLRSVDWGVAARTVGLELRLHHLSSRRAMEVSRLSLRIVPVTFRQACDFIAVHHRPPRGMKFAVGVAHETELVGVAIVGRPVARHLDDGVSVEVTRTCTTGTRNANSKLYGVSWRVARALGFQRLITYTQDGESGASLRAAGFRPVAVLRPRPGWTTVSRPRQSHGVDGIRRTRWEIRAER